MNTSSDFQLAVDLIHMLSYMTDYPAFTPTKTVVN